MRSSEKAHTHPTLHVPENCAKINSSKQIASKSGAGMEKTMKITIIDGQGGRIGKSIIEQIRKNHSDLELYAIGTNSIATSAMLKAGADYGATGDNAVIVNAADSDIIAGPIGIVFANALLGEITPAIATAIAASKAYKILIPVNRCNHFVAGCTEASMGEYIRIAVEKIESML